MKLRAYLHMLAVGGVLLGAGLGSGSALAQQQAPMSPRMQALVREYIEVTNATKMFDDIITSSVPALMNQLRQRNAQIPADLVTEMTNAMIEEFRATEGQMIEALAGVIGRTLSEEDLAGVIAFYRTPTGQHILAAAPRMAQEILPLASRWGQEAAQRAMQRAIGKARERGIQL
jgi:hypothetical protein